MALHKVGAELGCFSTIRAWNGICICAQDHRPAIRDINRPVHSQTTCRAYVSLCRLKFDLDWRWALELGCLMSINPDAPSTREIDLTHWGVKMARKGGYPKTKCSTVCPSAASSTPICKTRAGVTLPRARCPSPLRPLQPLLIRAAIDLTPHWVRTIVGLTDRGLNVWEAGVVRQIGAFADRFVLETNPAVQVCRRMRLSANYLYVHDDAAWL